MATTTVDDVLCIAPQFEDQKDRIEKLIPIACMSVSESEWGDKAAHAGALLTAHMMVTLIQQGGAAGGAIKRERIGDQEIEYENRLGGSSDDISSDERQLATTAYGREYLRCRNTLVITPMLTGC